MSPAAAGGPLRGSGSRNALGPAGWRPAVRFYLVLSVIVGLAAVVTGLVLAAAPSVDEPVIAVAPVPSAKSLSAPLKGIVADALAHNAGLLLLVARTPGQAAAATDALDGYVPPPPPRPAPPARKPGESSKKRKVGRSATPSPTATRSPTATAPPHAISGPPPFAVIYQRDGIDAVVRQLPASADVLVMGASGDSIRYAARPGGHGGLLVLFSCLLLAFAYLMSRTVSALRTSPDSGRAAAGTSGRPSGRPPSRPGEFRPGQPDQSGRRPLLTRRDDEPPDIPESPGPADDDRLLAASAILDRYRPSAVGDGWQPQCPWCGSFSVRALVAPSASHDLACLACEHHWQAADPGSWPDTVVSHRRRHAAADTSRHDNQTKEV